MFKCRSIVPPLHRGEEWVGALQRCEGGCNLRADATFLRWLVSLVADYADKAVFGQVLHTTMADAQPQSMECRRRWLCSKESMAPRGCGLRSAEIEGLMIMEQQHCGSRGQTPQRRRHCSISRCSGGPGLQGHLEKSINLALWGGLLP